MWGGNGSSQHIERQPKMPRRFPNIDKYQVQKKRFEKNWISGGPMTEWCSEFIHACARFITYSSVTSCSSSQASLCVSWLLPVLLHVHIRSPYLRSRASYSLNKRVKDKQHTSTLHHFQIFWKFWSLKQHALLKQSWSSSVSIATRPLWERLVHK